MKLLLVFFFLGIVASASEIRWTGSGTVSGMSGSGFDGLATAGDPVQIELVYDSGCLVDGRSLLPIGGSLAGRAWFHGAADLSITITVGENSWVGEMPTVGEGTNVMESLCWDPSGTTDWFKVTLDAARGGTFPGFPYGGSETARSLEIEFRDDVSPTGLFSVHQLPNSLSCLPELTSASGAVRAGADSISFTLDLSTVKVAQPGVPLSIARISEGIELIWETENGKNYRLESTPDLKCWIWEGDFLGDGNPISEVFNPFGFDSKRFYRVVEN